MRVVLSWLPVAKMLPAGCQAAEKEKSRCLSHLATRAPELRSTKTASVASPTTHASFPSVEIAVKLTRRENYHFFLVFTTFPKRFRCARLALLSKLMPANVGTSDCSDIAPPPLRLLAPASAQHLRAGLGCANSQLPLLQLMPSRHAEALSPAVDSLPAGLGCADQHFALLHLEP